MTHPSLRVVVLGSGSAGNATVVSNNETTILIDCGFSAREVARRMTSSGLDPSHVSAVFLTHEHGDHLRGIDVFCRRHARDAQVIASGGTICSAAMDPVADRATRVACGETVTVGTLSVTAFKTSHDAAEPLGFRVDGGGHCMGVVTDTGMLTPQANEALVGCDVLAIECNHDLDMLENGPYPYHLKRRIRSAYGHLSNNDAADAVERLASDRLRRVIAMHRSATNNTHGLAGRAIAARLTRIGLEVPVEVARQDTCVDSHPPQTSLFD